MYINLAMSAVDGCAASLSVLHQSGDKRMVVDTLGGAFCGPRPPSLTCKVAGRLENGMAVLMSCAVYSGLSLSISSGFGFLLIRQYLTLVGLTKTDDPNTFGSFSEHQCMYAAIKVAQLYAKQTVVTLLQFVKLFCYYA